MKKYIAFFIFMLFSLGLRAENTFGPVLTFADKKVSKMTLLFHTEKPKKLSLFLSNALTNYWKSDKSPKKYHRFKIKLKGAESLFYRVIGGDFLLNSKVGEIRIPTKTGYRFVVVGETSGGQPRYRKMSALFQYIQMYKPDFFVHTGNIIADSLSLSAWADYFRAGDGLFARLPQINAVGEYDFYSVLWRRLYDVSNNRQPFYSYRFPLMNIIVVNSEMYFAKDSLQYHWLLKELKKLDPQKWHVILMYRSPLERNNKWQTDKILRPLLKKYGIDVVFCGNGHYYERSRFGKTLVINSGGGGATLYESDYANPWRRKIVFGGNHFVLADVSAKMLKLRAIDGQGREIDKVQLSR